MSEPINHPYPHAWAAVEAAGKNDPERAVALGVAQRTIMRWRAGQMPDCFKYFKLYPPLLRGLWSDILDTNGE